MISPGQEYDGARKARSGPIRVERIEGNEAVCTHLPSDRQVRVLLTSLTNSKSWRLRKGARHGSPAWVPGGPKEAQGGTGRSTSEG